MKWWRIYLYAFSIETLGMLVYNLIVGSHPDERIFFNLSISRLIIVVSLGFIVLLTIWILWQSYQNKETFLKRISNDHLVWGLVIISTLLLGASLFLITRNPIALGKYQQVYENFKPHFVWVYILSLQTWLFAITWFCHYCVRKKADFNGTNNDNDLLIPFGIFLVLVLLKIILIIPSAYGPVIRGDEFRYFDMANFLYYGIFYINSINHSPFFYPLMLSIAFNFGKHTYLAIKILNVIFSSSIIFPVFLMARKYFSQKNTTMITILTCLLPYHIVFPRIIMSENIYFPILLWTILFILNVPRRKNLALSWQIYTGFSIGLLYMTRYITLPSIGTLMLAWWFIHPGKNKKIFQPDKKKIIDFILFCAGIILGFSPWLILGKLSDLSLKTLLGFSITANTTTNQQTLANLLIWLSLYLAYFILMAAPMLPAFTALIGIKNKNWPTAIKNWLIVIGALFLGFLSASVRHSWRAIYNSDLPSRIMGRYVLYFTPLLIISALLLQKLENQNKGKTIFRYLFETVVLPLILVTIAYLHLFSDIFNLHDGNLISILGSVDGAYIQYLGGFFFVFLLILYICIFYLTRIRYLRKGRNIIIFTMIAFYLTGIHGYYQELVSYQNFQFIGAQIIELVESGVYHPQANVIIYTPENTTERERALMFNTIYFYQREDIYVSDIVNYSPDFPGRPDEIENTQAIRIIELQGFEDTKNLDGKILEFGNSKYTLIY